MRKLVKEKFLCLLCLFLLFLQSVFPRITSAFCFREAGERFGVPPVLLMAIAKVESNYNPASWNINRDGSIDHGLMQINDWWLKRLRPYGITREWLYDPCTSCMVGAWILNQNLKRLRLTTWNDPKAWKAVGAYNATSAEKKNRYIRKVYKAYTQIQTSYSR